MKPDLSLRPYGILTIEDEIIDWQDFFGVLIETMSNQDDEIVVDQNIDGVEEILEVVDGLRYAAEQLEEMLRQKKIRVENLPDSSVITFSKYMRGQY